MLKVANLDIFWSNGSYETPINHPPLNLFKDVPNANIARHTVDVGTVILKGQWNYAHIDGSYYFLDRIATFDIDKDVHKYSMIRDLSYELTKLDDLVINGELNRLTERTLVKENINLVNGILENPAEVQLIDVKNKALESGRMPIKDLKELNISNTEFVISTITWDNFVKQYKAIPDKRNPPSRQAILAALTTDPIKYWKYVIYNDYLRPLIEDLKNNLNKYKLAQIVNTTSELNNKFQLIIPTATDDSLGKAVSPIEHLKGLDFSTITDIIPVNLSTLTLLTECEVKTYDNIPNRRTNPVGYFSAADFYKSDKPWEDKNPEGSARVAPYESTDFGIAENLKLSRLGKSRDNLLAIDVAGLTKAEELHKHRESLEELDKMLKDVAYYQPSFLDNVIESNSLIGLLDQNNVYYWHSGDYRYLYGTWAAYTVGSSRRLADGLPRREDGSFNYQGVANLLNGRLTHSWTYTTFDYNYFVFLNGKVVGLRTQEEQDNIVRKIRQLKETLPLPNPETDKRAIISSVYSHLGHVVDDGREYCINPDDYAKGLHLFNLIGTNYYLLLNKGRGSIILKNIETDKKDTHVDIYEYLEDVQDDKLNELINSRRFLSIYGKEYELNDKINEIRDLKISKLSPTSKLNAFENLIIEYKTDFTNIFDVNAISKEEVTQTLSNFNAIEYERTLRERDRGIIDHELTLAELRIQRNKYDFDQRQTWAQYNQEYTQNIVNIALGGIGAVANLAGSIVSGGATAGLLGSAALGGATMASNSIFNMMAANRKYEQLKYEEKNNLLSRAIENNKLDTHIHRLEQDNKIAIDNYTKLTSTTAINDRDILNQLKNIWKVGDVFLKVLKPTNKQNNLINAHHSHYGYECNIPNFSLEWRNYKDKTNIWGFKYITSINIKDPIIRTYVVGKFLNGLKLIRPTF